VHKFQGFLFKKNKLPASRHIHSFGVRCGYRAVVQGFGEIVIAGKAKKKFVILGEAKNFGLCPTTKMIFSMGF
jgi:hypothetical protein